MIKKIISMQVLLLFLVLSSASYGQTDRLNIIYTGSLQGQLEPCGCSPKSDFGGMARIEGYISAHEEDLSPYLLIDAGNFSGKNTPQGKLKTTAIIDLISSMKYTAVGYSENEKTQEKDFFASLLNSHTIPFVSAMPGHSKSASYSQNSFDINLSSVPEDIKPEKLNILITGISWADAKDLNGWDIIITSSGEELEGPVMTENSTVIVSGYPKGNKIGILTLNKGSDGNIRYSHRWQPTGKDIKETESTQAILDTYNSKVSDLMKETDKPPTGTTYTGVTECTLCHQPFIDSWEKTRHAHAFASLEEVGKTSDPECVVCHVVGFRETGGFFNIESTPQFANVQCEVCHGIGRAHVEDYLKTTEPVTEKTCLKCHTEENSPEFDYPVYLEKIKH